MSKRANPAALGAFIIAAVTLGVAGVLMFGGGRFFAPMLSYVLFFDGSVKGLSVGAPVTLRGVAIGSVSRIVIAVDEQRDTLVTPVYIDLDPATITKTAGHWGKDETREYLERLVAKGLCGQLHMQSLVTGQLAVELDFHPDERPRRVQPKGPVPEIPTIPSSIEQLSRSLQQLPLEDLLKKALSVLDNLDAMLADPRLKDSIGQLNGSLSELQDLIAKLNGQIDPLSKQLGAVSQSSQELLGKVNSRVGPMATEIEEAMKETRRLSANLNARVDRLAPQIETTAAAMRSAVSQLEQTLALQKGPAAELVVELKRASTAASEAFEQAETSLAAVRSTTADGSPLQYDLRQALQELSTAARAVRGVADYLERHPEALLHGRGRAGGN